MRIISRAPLPDRFSASSTRSSIGRLICLPLIPGIEGLTESCCQSVGKLGEDFGKAWEVLTSQCKKGERPVNVEDILSKVRTKIDAIGDGETLVGLDAEKLARLEKEIGATIAKVVNPKIPHNIPHNEMASWVKKVNRTK